MFLLLLLFAGARAQACGTCPCVASPCANSTECCAPTNWTLGNASICLGGGCAACVALGDACVSDEVCRCDGTQNASCVAAVCQADAPDAPCGFCPCGGQPCANTSECCDPALFGLGNASFCDSDFCAPCIAPGDDCGADIECQCYSPLYQCLPGPGFSFLCTFVPTFAPTGAPTLEIPCQNVSQCPANNYCVPGAACVPCDIEGPVCCDTGADCDAGQYCSPAWGICLACVGAGGNCSQDPVYACACNASDNLTCQSQVCATSAPPGSNGPLLIAILVGTLGPLLLVLLVCCCCLRLAVPVCRRRCRDCEHVEEDLKGV